MISLRDVALQLVKHGRQDEVPGILDAGSSIVASFCDAVRVPETYKAAVACKSTKVPVRRLDPEYNLLYLQMNAAVEIQEGAEKHEILLSLDEYIRCPLSMKDIVDIVHPVRSVTCGHIYEQSDIMVYVGSIMKDCPVPGCPGVVSADLVFEDAELRRDIRADAHKRRQDRRMAWGVGREDVPVTRRLFHKELGTG